MPPLTSYVRSGPPPQLMQLLQQQQQPQGGGGANFLAQLIGGAGESAANVLQSYYDEPRATATRQLEAASALAPFMRAETGTELDQARIDEIEAKNQLMEEERIGMEEYYHNLDKVHEETPGISFIGATTKALRGVKGIPATSLKALQDSAKGLDAERRELTSAEATRAEKKADTFYGVAKAFSMGHASRTVLTDAGRDAGLDESVLANMTPALAGIIAEQKYPTQIMKKGWEEALLTVDPLKQTIGTQPVDPTPFTGPETPTGVPPVTPPVPLATAPEPPMTPPVPPTETITPPVEAAPVLPAAPLADQGQRPIDYASTGNVGVGDFTARQEEAGGEKSVIARLLNDAEVIASEAPLAPPVPANQGYGRGVQVLAGAQPDPGKTGVWIWRKDGQGGHYKVNAYLGDERLGGFRGQIPGDRLALQKPSAIGETERKTIREAFAAKDAMSSLIARVQNANRTGSWEKIRVSVPKVLDEWAVNLFGSTSWLVDPRNTEAVINNARQLIGKMKEGGVLRREDEIKYEKMLVNIADAPETADFKIEMFTRETEMNAWHIMKELEAAGYEMTELKELYGVPDHAPWAYLGVANPDRSPGASPWLDHVWVPLSTEQQRETFKDVLDTNPTFRIIDNAARARLIEEFDLTGRRP